MANNNFYNGRLGFNDEQLKLINFANQQAPTGRAGQAASFAQVEQAKQQRAVQQRQAAESAAQQVGASAEQEVELAQRRAESAKQGQLQEQQAKLEQQRFTENQTLQRQQLLEDKTFREEQERQRQDEIALREAYANLDRQQQMYDNMRRSGQIAPNQYGWMTNSSGGGVPGGLVAQTSRGSQLLQVNRW